MAVTYGLSLVPRAGCCIDGYGLSPLPGLIRLCSNGITSCGHFSGCCYDVLAFVPQCVLLSDYLGPACCCTAKCAASSPPHILCGLQHESRCSVLWLFIIMLRALQWLVPRV
jgi:hypothetical protein